VTTVSTPDVLPAPRPRHPLLTRGQLVVVIVTVLAVAASLVSAALVVPPAVRGADPALPVRAYLQAVVSGDITKALTLGGITPAAGDKLLTDAAYGQSANRVTSFAVLDTAVSGAAGTVLVRVQQGDQSYQTAFDVQRERGAALFAPWRLAPQTLPQISFRLAAPIDRALKVAGVELTATKGLVTQRVFPGDYESDDAGPADYFAADWYVTASARFGVTAVTPTAIGLQLADGASASIASAAAAWLNGCAASTQLAPSGCPFKAIGDPTVAYSDGRWSLESQPVLTEGDWDAALGGWPVATTQPGHVTFTAHATQGGLSGTASTGSVPFRVLGVAIPESSGKLRFQPITGAAVAAPTA